MTNQPMTLTKDEDWVIDLNVFKAKERPAIDAALKSGRDEAAYPFMARAIKVWPYKDLDPSKPDSYGELGLVDQAEAVGRFLLSFQQLVNAITTLANRYQIAGAGDRAGAPESAHDNGH